MITAQLEIFLGRFTLSDARFYQPGVWFYLHVVSQMWQKCMNVVGSWCLCSFWHHRTKMELNNTLLLSDIKVANCLWKPNSKGNLMLYILRSQTCNLFFMFFFLCCVFFFSAARHSPDPRREAATKGGSSGITDEPRWTVSGKVLWETFNVFYISVSELSRNTWITQCQPNTA